MLMPPSEGRKLILKIRRILAMRMRRQAFPDIKEVL